MKYILSLTIFVGLVWFTLPMKLKDGQLETVLSNDRVLSNYIKCLLDQGPCTREGAELKSKIIILSQYLIDFCTFFVQSFPLKKFRHFFTFKRYMLFWTYDTVADLYHLIVIVLSVVSFEYRLKKMPQYIVNLLKFAKALILFCMLVLQNSFRTLYNRIVRRAARSRSATPEK